MFPELGGGGGRSLELKLRGGEKFSGEKKISGGKMPPLHPPLKNPESVWDIHHWSNATPMQSIII